MVNESILRIHLHQQGSSSGIAGQAEIIKGLGYGESDGLFLFHLEKFKDTHNGAYPREIIFTYSPFYTVPTSAISHPLGFDGHEPDINAAKIPTVEDVPELQKLKDEGELSKLDENGVTIYLKPLKADPMGIEEMWRNDDSISYLEMIPADNSPLYVLRDGEIGFLDGFLECAFIKAYYGSVDNPDHLKMSVSQLNTVINNAIKRLTGTDPGGVDKETREEIIALAQLEAFDKLFKKDYIVRDMVTPEIHYVGVIRSASMAIALVPVRELAREALTNLEGIPGAALTEHVGRWNSPIQTYIDPSNTATL